MVKLYSFQPKWHGPLSFFVMAESKAKAIEFIDDEIARRKMLRDEDNISEYDVKGWKTDNYICTEVIYGEVLTNPND